MSENQSTRRKFLQYLGLSAGATLVSSGALAAISAHDDIKKLSSAEREFMLDYGKWMDEFIEVIKVQKTDPDNSENNRKMITLTDSAEKMQPQLTEYMKGERFALIYQASIARMRNEI